MVAANRTSEEQRVLDASDAILEIIGDDTSRQFDPTDLVNQAAKTHDRYSARAAVLHLLEIGKLKLSADWHVMVAGGDA